MSRITESLKRRLHQLSLLQRLLIVEGAAFIVIVGGMIFVANMFADALRTRAEQSRLASAEAFAAETDELLSHGLHELRLLSGFLDARLTDERSGLDLVVLESDLFTAGAVRTDGSMRVVDSDAAHRSLLGLNLQPFIANASQGNDGALGWGMRVDEGDSPVVALAIPRAAGGGSDGYLVGLIDPFDSSLTSVLRRAQRTGDTMHGDLINEHAIAVVSTAPGQVLVSSDHPAFYREMLDSDVASGIREVPHDDHGDTSDPEEYDENHVMGFARINTLPWGFAVGGTASETFALVGRLWTSVYGAAAVVVTIAVGLTVMGTDRLLQPVRDLRETAHRVADGNLDTPMQTSDGGEIGELAESIERMRGSLNARRAELDQRVKERTAELERRTQELAASAAIARVVSSTIDLTEMLDLAVAEMQKQLGVDAVIAFVAGDGERPPLVRTSPGAIEEFGAPGIRPCHYCVDQGAGTIVTHDGTKGSTDHGPPWCLNKGYASTTAMPLWSMNRQVGSLCFLNAEPPEQPLELRILRLLVSQLGIGIENAVLYGDLQRREAYRQKLLAKVFSAQEDERQRLARELHDETGQALTALMMGLDAIARSSPERWQRTIEQISNLRALSEESLDNLRQMVLALRPSQLDDLGLLAAIERYADRVVRSTGINVEIESSLGDERLPPTSEVAVFRIVQEALNNVGRHSGATDARVRISRHHGQLCVEVSDDGHGFVPHESTGLNGVGIEGMTERADLLGGHLTVESTPGEGTTVRLKVQDERSYETRPIS